MSVRATNVISVIKKGSVGRGGALGYTGKGSMDCLKRGSYL